MDGRFYRGIPGFLVWVKVGCSDSVHGGHCRASLAKKFLKKRVKNRKIGVREGPEADPRAPHIGCAGMVLNLEASPLAALVEVCFVRAPQLRAPAMRSQRFAPLIYRGPIASSIAHLMGVSPLVRPVILQPSPVA